MQYKAIIADVDGTLIPPGAVPAPHPSKRLVTAVKKAKTLGVTFSLASARSLAWVTEIIEGLSLDAPIILDNGARIYDCSQKNIYGNRFCQKKKQKKY